MSNGNGKIDWTSLWRNEDWWACWLGWFILLLAIIGLHETAAGKWAVGLIPLGPKVGSWTSSLSAAFPQGVGTIWSTLWLFIFLAVITMIGGTFMKFDLKRYILGFIVIFLISYLSMILAKQAFMAKWGIAYVIFALIIGLIISNIFKVPRIMKVAGQTEYFIKIGLVCMGATILFGDLARGGAMGILQALLVAVTVWFMTYFICRKFQVSERFSSITATANSICGVSATIAAGGAIQGDKKEVSYMVAWVLVCAAVLILVMPPLAILMNLPNNWAGAWIGGVIDNTGAVVAAGTVVGGDAAVKVAGIVKMAQNVLIGFAAFFLAIWATMTLD